jgi:hypothetical protein
LLAKIGFQWRGTMKKVLLAVALMLVVVTVMTIAVPSDSQAFGRWRGGGYGGYYGCGYGCGGYGWGGGYPVYYGGYGWYGGPYYRGRY